jgi:large subunit ribosomal protein L24
MKKEFSKHWKSSKQPRKQRKFLAKAPLHVKRKFLGANLSKELRKNQGKRNVVLRKGDTVKIMRGKFKEKRGKIIDIKIKTEKVYVEGIQRTKMDGSKKNIPLKASNLQILELNLDDNKRFKKNVQEIKETKDIKEKMKKEKENAH